MTLTGPQARQFGDALLSGFPTHADLRQLLYFALDTNLDAIAAQNSLGAVVTDVLIWVQANGRLDDLVIAMGEARPHNPVVSQLVADFARWKTEARPATAARAAPVNATALRQALVDAFSAEELQSLCADIEQMLQDRGVTLKVDLDTVGGASKPAQALNLIQFLQRRGQLDALVEAVRAARPGLV